ncbi:hypothetical protein F4861DRAFT_2267 [Xylaria intraflava]|nr:hypothetical protein F4861DRAFT_2267 [Xylaria intraflava]
MLRWARVFPLCGSIRDVSSCTRPGDTYTALSPAQPYSTVKMHIMHVNGISPVIFIFSACNTKDTHPCPALSCLPVSFLSSHPHLPQLRTYPNVCVGYVYVYGRCLFMLPAHYFSRADRVTILLCLVGGAPGHIIPDLNLNACPSYSEMCCIESRRVQA